MNALIAVWRRCFPTRAQSRAAMVCLVVGVLLAVFLAVARKPWDAKILSRMKGGRDPRLADFITIGLWWAALANVAGVFVLGIAARWWMRDLEAPGREAVAAPCRAPRGFAVGIMAAMALCLAMAWPRMSMSFWGDEEHAMRQVVFGKYVVSRKGEVTLERTTGTENLWMYRGPNNHPLFSLCSRLCQEIHRSLSGGAGADFSESAARFPSLVAGLLGIWVAGVLLLRLGNPGAGVLAAFFLALHPWYLRYAAEARGYAMVLLFLLLACLSLHHAWRTLAWRWWIGFAASLFAALYTYPAALYACASLGLAAISGIWLDRSRSVPERRVAAARLCASGAVAAMVFLQIIAPCIPQMALYLKRDRARGVVGIEWTRDFWGYLNGGTAWTTWDASNPLCQAVDQLPPALFWSFALLLPALAIAGAIRWWGTGIHGRLMLAALLVAPVLAILHARGMGSLLYVWYLIYALIPFALCVAAGITWPFAALATRGLGMAGGLAGGLLFLAWFACLTQPQREILRTHPIEPQRESVLATRPTLNPYDPMHRGISTAQFVFTTPLYDPHAVMVKTADDLRRVMGRADRDHKPLYVNFASEGWANHAFPDIKALIDDPGAFAKHRVFYGLDVQMTRVVYRYRGKPE